MKGVCLAFYTSEVKKHKGVLLYEWLLDSARKHQIEGCTVFRSVAGYSSHGFHEASFFELGSNVPVEIKFLVSKEDSEKIFKLLEEENIEIFYSSTEAEFGVLGTKKP